MPMQFIVNQMAAIPPPPMFGDDPLSDAALMWRDGATWVEIESETGVGRGKLRHHLERSGEWRGRETAIPDKALKQAAALRKKGWAWKDIGPRFDRSPRTISHAVRAKGLLDE